MTGFRTEAVLNLSVSQGDRALTYWLGHSRIVGGQRKNTFFRNFYRYSEPRTFLSEPLLEQFIVSNLIDLKNLQFYNSTRQRLQSFVKETKVKNKG